MAVYYVDKGVGAGGAGTEGDPFDSILDAFDACFPLEGDPATRQPLAEDTTIYLKSTLGTPDLVASTPTMEYTGGSTLTLIQTDRTSPVWDDTKYRLVREDGGCLASNGSGGAEGSQTHRLTARNVQFEQSSVSSNNQVMLPVHTRRGRRGVWSFDSCLFKGSGDDIYSKRVFRLDADNRFNALTIMRNCVVFNMGDAGGTIFYGDIGNDGLNALMCVNNTFDCPSLVMLSNTSPYSARLFLIKMFNNILDVSGYGAERYRNSHGIDADYNTCFFEDDDVIDSVDGETVLWTHGANDIVNVASLPFTNAAAGDYRLSTSDGNVVDAGTSMSEEYTMPTSSNGTPPPAPGFTHDHLETSTRPQGAAWDIGAYEFIAPEVFNYPRFLMGPKA